MTEKYKNQTFHLHPHSVNPVNTTALLETSVSVSSSVLPHTWLSQSFAKAFFTNTGIVLLSLVRWFFFSIFSPVISRICEYHGHIAMQKKRNCSSAAIHGEVGIAANVHSIADSLLPPYKSVRGELNTCCCAVSAVERDWWRVDGHPASQFFLWCLTRAVSTYYENWHSRQNLFQVLKCFRVQTEADWHKTEGWDSGLHEENGNAWKLQLLTRPARRETSSFILE